MKRFMAIGTILLSVSLMSMSCSAADFLLGPETSLVEPKPAETSLVKPKPDTIASHQEALLARPSEVVSGDNFASLGYDLNVKDIESKVDVTISSTVPVNLKMQGDCLVIEQLCGNKKKRVRTRVHANKAVTVDIVQKKKEASEYLYNIPTWPVHVACFEDKDKIEVKFRYKCAGNSYSSSGHTQDLSKLVFGEDPLYVRDVLLASKLVEDGQVLDYSSGSGSGGYLGLAASHGFCFDASVDEYKLDFSYVRHFRNNDISLGVNIPFAWKKHSLSLSTTAGPILGGNSSFNAKYGEDCKLFLQDILGSKNNVLTESDTESGIGDISAFINFEITSKRWERFLTGIEVVLPTARERNVHKLWAPELGNGGFTTVSAFISSLFSYHQLVNPHIMVQGRYGFAADVPRRIPSTKSYQETSAGGMNALGDILAMGELVRTTGTNPGPATNFSEVDTTFRRFSTETEHIKLRKGSEFFLRVGNMIEEFILEGGFLDLYYDLRFKGCDYISNNKFPEEFVPEILKHNTHEVEHRAGLTFSYQFDEHVRVMAGALYSFAGRNIPKTFEANARLIVEF